MKRRFILSSGLDTSIELEIDLAKLTPELATEINDYFANDAVILTLCGGDPIQAVARRAAQALLQDLRNGLDKREALSELVAIDGWPDSDLGIEIIDYEIPSIDADEFEVEELETR